MLESSRTVTKWRRASYTNFTLVALFKAVFAQFVTGRKKERQDDI